MGLFGRLFGRDPAALLARAEEALERGEPGLAAELAARVLRGRDPAVRLPAEALASRANLAQVDSLLERVVAAEEAELFEEALDYLGAALERAEDEGLRRQLEQRRADLEGRIARRRPAATEVVEVAAAPAQSPDEAYETQLGTLSEEVAGRYENRSETFRNAYLALVDGRAEEALEGFDLLIELDPDDPVLRLERGRSLLLAGEAARAAEELELAWDGLGEGALDHRGDLSVPLLWGEAVLASGGTDSVVDRLWELARPRRGNPQLTHVVARALLAAERLEEAEALLRQAASTFPEHQDFAHDLGQLLDRLGRREEAIAHLEAALRPACSGSCGGPPLHPPTLRLLGRLYLDRGDARERAGELLRMATNAQGGLLTEEDLELRERLEQAGGP